LLVTRGMKGFEKKIVNLSMISEVLRSEIRSYYASLVIGRSA
jgi:hypothetical protein